MVTSIGSISVLFSFSLSDISASNCDASHCSKYQDGGREALLLERITAGCKRPLDSGCPVRGRTCYFINYLLTQKLPRKAKVALVAVRCSQYKKLLKTLKVAQKLPSTIYFCLDWRKESNLAHILC